MRMPRINIQNTLYYVTNRGDNQENIFIDEADYKAHIEFLKKCKDQFGFKLFAYCLLPNHLHLLIELKENSSISQIMHNLNSNYTKYFNKRHNRQGHLLQERFKLILMEKAPYLADTTAYIHLNPLAIIPNKDYENYAYSSYPLYIGKENLLLNLKEETNEVLGYLPGKNYAGFVRDFYQGKSKDFAEGINRKSILGSDEFVAMVKTEMEKTETPIVQAKPRIPAKFIFIGIIIIIIAGSLSFYLYNKTLRIKENISKELEKQQKQMDIKIIQEKYKISKDLDEKYQADLISFEAMKARLDLEKQKTQDLEKKLNTGKKEQKGAK